MRTHVIFLADVYGMPFNPDSVYSRIKDIPPEESTAAHAVFIVGYDDTGRYWLVKNSWGPDWPAKGRGGVFKVGRDPRAAAAVFTPA
jgi:C1A family cysteine protease